MKGRGAEEPGRPLAVVFLDGDYGDPAWYRALAERADILLAADGGAAFLAGLGMTPRAVVGDFDSLAEAEADALRAAGVEMRRHPVRKDRTDGELVVDEALRRGARELLLAGGTGALDHTLGHLAILRRLAARRVVARLVAPDLSVAALVAPVDVTLAAPAGTRVSLVAPADAVVSLAGLEYPLDHGRLPADVCVGLGNTVSPDGRARIVVHTGSVLALVGWGDEDFGGGRSVPPAEWDGG